VVSRFKVLIAAGALVSGFAFGEAVSDEPTVIVPGPLFGSNMVLQRDKNAVVWGTGTDGQSVSVSINGQTQNAVVHDGRWRVALDPESAGGPYVLTIASGDQKTVFENVMFGEVWFAGGQSNMRFPLFASTDAEALFASGKLEHPQLRLFAMPERINELDRDLPIKGWQESSRESATDFSAVAWFFGMHLQQQLDVPVGIIMSSRGGTPAEAWMAAGCSNTCPPFAAYADGLDRQYRENFQSLEAYQEAYRQYREDFKTHAKKVSENKPSTPPVEPHGPYSSQRPAGLYDSMIKPLAPFTLKGFLWYQGESNMWRAYDYRLVLTSLISNWRRDFEDESLPFLIVQLPGYGCDGVAHSIWAEVRDSQFSVAQKVPGAELVAIPELGDKDNIHPKQKEPVGFRLSLLARGLIYGEELTCSGPMYKSVRFDDARAMVSFDHSGNELVQKGDTLNGFTICGADKVFHPAEAVVVGETVVVSSEQVDKPIAVRYLWKNWIDGSEVSLFNDADLPASPFRTDDFKLVTQK